MRASGNQILERQREEEIPGTRSSCSLLSVFTGVGGYRRNFVDNIVRSAEIASSRLTRVEDR